MRRGAGSRSRRRRSLGCSFVGLTTTLAAFWRRKPSAGRTCTRSVSAGTAGGSRGWRRPAILFRDGKRPGRDGNSRRSHCRSGPLDGRSPSKAGRGPPAQRDAARARPMRLPPCPVCPFRLCRQGEKTGDVLRGELLPDRARRARCRSAEIPLKSPSVGESNDRLDAGRLPCSTRLSRAASPARSSSRAM